MDVDGRRVYWTYMVLANMTEVTPEQEEALRELSDGDAMVEIPRGVVVVALRREADSLDDLLAELANILRRAGFDLGESEGLPEG